MYLDYFSLDRHPFRITPDPSLFFEGGQDGRGVILNALIYGITSGEGILKVVGEVGSGKTMLCRMLEEKLPDSVEIVYLANPRLSAREILYAIAIELKLEVTAATERLKVMHMLQDYLLAKHSQGGTVVVFIEEAQSMPLETLEEIRLLSNLETHQHKLMQIVLFGQPELDKILAQKNIRQLRERITHSFRLEPLTTQATGDYLRYRLQAAGCPRSNIFSPRAEKLIARASSGLTRRINILADKSLLAAYADSPSRQPAHDSDTPLVQPRHVKAAIKDSDYRDNRVNPWLWGSLAVTSVVVAVIAFIALEREPAGPAASTVATSAVPDTPLPEMTGQVERDVSPPQDSADTSVLAAAATVSDSAVTQAVALAEAAEELAEQAGEQLASQAPASELREPPVERASTTGVAETLADTIDAPSESGELALALTDTALTADMPSETAADTAPPALAITREQAEPVLSQEPAMAQGNPEPRDVDEQAGKVVSEEVVSAARTQPADNSEAIMAPPPVAVTPSGLAARRMQPTADWLRSLDSKTGYTIQLFSVPSTNPAGLEEYLQFLQLVSLLDDTYICFRPISSASSGRWQVMHQEFAGVTPARNMIAELPAYITQYGPYVSNLNGIECSYPVDTRD